jgi:predicted acetyltransferase
MSTEQYELRAVEQGEHDALFALLHRVFHASDDAWREVEEGLLEPGRTVGVFEEGELVGSAAMFGRELTIPGGVVPAACVAQVAVSPTRTRRGLFTRMMRHQLDTLHEQGEPLALLWATEGGLYRRFGYGVGSWMATYTGRTRETTLRVQPDSALHLAVREASGHETLAALATSYEQVRRDRTGHLDRADRHWAYHLHDPAVQRRGTPLTAVVCEGPDGPEGYALYRVDREWNSGADGVLHIREVQATTPRAYAALLSYLLRLDLVPRFTWEYAAVDEPVVEMVTDIAALQREVIHNLWIRVVDVDRALTARAYATDLDLVLEVEDAFCPWNAGRWRLTADASGVQCRRTDAEAGLALSAEALASAYLGGTSLTTLAAAGVVRERQPGTLRESTLAFSTPGAPLCTDYF